jgi:hypothetical protein
MCPRHWRRVPKVLRHRIYDTYRAGQCDDKLPSLEWHQAADAAIGYVALMEGCPTGKLRVCEVRALLVLKPDVFGDSVEDMREVLAQRDGERRKVLEIKR